LYGKASEGVNGIMRFSRFGRPPQERSLLELYYSTHSYLPRKIRNFSILSVIGGGEDVKRS
jgi:hypothetical protein